MILVSAHFGLVSETSAVHYEECKKLWDKQWAEVGSTCRKLRKDGHVWREKNGLALREERFPGRGGQDPGAAWGRSAVSLLRGDQTCSQHRHGPERSVRNTQCKQKLHAVRSRLTSFVPGTGTGTSGQASARGGWSAEECRGPHQCIWNAGAGDSMMKLYVCVCIYSWIYIYIYIYMKC